MNSIQSQIQIHIGETPIQKDNRYDGKEKGDILEFGFYQHKIPFG